MAEPQNRILTDAHGDQLSLEHHDDADGIMRSLMLICEFLLNLKGYRDIEGYWRMMYFNHEGDITW